MKRTLHCPVCNSEFTTDKNAKKYCSAKCRRKANAQSAMINGMHKYSCSWCGGAFAAIRRKKYCSKECRLYANGRLGKKPKMKKTPSFTLSQVARLSREAGLSYGQYVQKYQLS